MRQLQRDDWSKQDRGFPRYRFLGATVLVVVVLLLSSCGSTNPDPPQVLSCGADRQDIVGLLQSGLPTYGYNPATDLADLVRSSDVVMTGTLDSIARVAADDGSGGSLVTVISTGDAKVLAQGDQVDASATGTFSYTSGWADTTRTDPLLVPTNTIDVVYLAFLSETPSVPGGFLVRVQGLFVGCLNDSRPLSPIIATLPSDAGPLMLPDLIDAIVDSPDAS